MKKTKRSRIAFWLVGCSALLVAALAARAQTQNYVVDDFAPAGVGPANPTITTTTQRAKLPERPD